MLTWVTFLGYPIFMWSIVRCVEVVFGAFPVSMDLVFDAAVTFWVFLTVAGVFHGSINCVIIAEFTF